MTQAAGMLLGNTTTRSVMATEVVENKGQGRQRSKCVDDTMTQATGIPSQDVTTKGHDNKETPQCRVVIMR